MLTYHPDFQYVSELMSAVAEAPTMSPSDAAARVRELAGKIRQNTREIPRGEPLNHSHLAVLRLARMLACGLSDMLVKSCPTVGDTDELADLADAIDDLDNQIENHEIAQTIGPRIVEMRAALAV